MASPSRRANYNTYIWPGFVDSLATLLMVIMFLLLVFVLAQFFMSQALTGRDKALSNLKSQIGELAELLSLERLENKNIRTQLTQLSQELQVSTNLQDDLKTALSDLKKRYDNSQETVDILQAQATAMRARNDKYASKNKTLEDEIFLIQSQKDRLGALTSELRKNLSKAGIVIQKQLLELKTLSGDILRLRALKQKLETEISSLGEKLLSGKVQITDLTKILSERNKTISSLTHNLRKKEDLILERQTELESTKQSYLTEKQLSKSALAEVALLNQQMASLRRQLSKIEIALKLSETDSAKKQIQIAALGKRLNIALASKVQELSKYRSEFFGRLRSLIGSRRDIRIVGDRFVFQSEVLFEKGQSELGVVGREGLDQLASTLLELSKKIPPEIDWVLRIDGHTDDDPISTARYPSNWELSTSRATSVLKHLINAGLPPGRLVAAGFGQYHPLDKRSDEIGKRRNRRIEMKLTQR